MTWLQTWIINQDPVALVLTEKGGPGSGNWGHAGVKGQRGGSAPKSGMGSAMSLASGPTADLRQFQAKEDVFIKEIEPAAASLYKAADRDGYLPTKADKLEVMRVFQGAKKAHKYGPWGEATDLPAMAETLQYVTSYGGLSGAKDYFQKLSGSLDPAQHDQGIEMSKRIKAIERGAGKEPKGLTKPRLVVVSDDPKQVAFDVGQVITKFDQPFKVNLVRGAQTKRMHVMQSTANGRVKGGKIAFFSMGVKGDKRGMLRDEEITSIDQLEKQGFTAESGYLLRDKYSVPAK